MSKKKRIIIVLIAIFVIALLIASPFIWAHASLPIMRVVVAGSGYTVSIGTDGTLWTWGLNNQAQLGDGTTINRSRPVQISADKDWVSVAADGHNIAIRADGSLWAWGSNFRGQLGDGTTHHRARPVQIGTDTDWSSVEVGWDVSFAIKEDGSLWHWGERSVYVADPDNPDGSIPRRGESYNAVPMQVGSDTDWASISIGINSVSAIKTDGTLWVWGEVNRIQDGNISTQLISIVPLQLGTGAEWASVVVGYDELLSIKTDGTLWVWKEPYESFIEPNTAIPTQIGIDTTWAMAANSGFGNYAAISTDGRLWTWGSSNPWGIFGDGTPRSISGNTEYRPTPVQVGTATDWTTVSLAGQHMVALSADGRVWTSGINDSGQSGRGNSDEYSLTLKPITRRLFLWTIGDG